MTLDAIFTCRPDVLDLILSSETSVDISIKPIVTAFGESKDRIFYYQDIPLGIVADLKPYHKTLGLSSDKNVVVHLAPALRASFPFPEITPESFRTALTQLLSSARADWILMCERDCDQESILHLEALMSDAQLQLDELFRFINGQPDATCPTFKISKANKPRHGNPS